MSTEHNSSDLSRRGFLGLSAGVIAAGAGSAALCRRSLARMCALDTTWFAWKQLSPKCWVAQGEGGNVLAVVGDNEVILIDAKNAGFGAALRREAEQTCGKPVRTLINTHHHGDHIGGNYAFTADCTVLSHGKALPRIASQGDRLLQGTKNAATQVGKSEKPGKDAILKDLAAFDGAGYTNKSWNPTRGLGDKETLTIGGVKFELTHVGPGHTDNDLIIFLPSENVMHAGDLMFNQVWPVIDRPGGSDTAGWIAACDAILGICAERKTIVVPGHGEVGEKEMAQRQKQMFIALRAKAAAAVKAGESREDFLKRPFEEYAEYQRADVLKPRTLGGVYDEAGRVPVK